MSSITIRKGTPSDMEAVHGLVRELAEFENAPEQVETSAEIFREDGFGANPLPRFLVAETAEKLIAGAAVYYLTYSTWKGKMMYLDDLIVTQSMRRKGVGEALFGALIAEAKSLDVRQLRWHVLDWNEPAIKFYQKINAELDPEWITCKLTREQLHNWKK